MNPNLNRFASVDVNREPAPFPAPRFNIAGRVTRGHGDGR